MLLLDVKKGKAPAGGKVTLIAEASRDFKNREVRIQRRAGKRWVDVAAADLGKNLEARIRLRADDIGKQQFRALLPKRFGRPKLVSSTVAVRVTRG